MCEVTWNIWGSVSVVLMPISMKESCIVAPLSLACSLLSSAFLDCFSLFRWHHTAWAQVWVHTHPCVIPFSWFMHIVRFSGCLDISIDSSSSSSCSFSLITLFFLMPVNFIFQDVIAKSPLRWGPLTLWSGTSLPRVMSPTSTTSRRSVLDWVAVLQRLRQRWPYHRQNALGRVSKTTRSLWTRRLVVFSVVVGQSLIERRDQLFAPIESRVSSVQESQEHNQREQFLKG